MIGWTLARYFFMRFTVITAWFTLGIFMLIFIIDFTEFSSRASALPAYSVVGAAAVSLMRMPFILQQLVPFIVLFSSMTTLIALNRKYELVVARSTGISAWQFLLPIGAGAFAFGLFALFVLNPLGAAGFEKSSLTEALWRSGRGNASQSAGIPWLRQRVGEEETIIGAHSVLGGGADLRDVVFYRLAPDQSIAERIDAERALLKDGYWDVTNAVRRPGDGAVEKVARLRIDTNLKVENIGEKLSRPETLAWYDLSGKITAARAFGYQVPAYRTQFHFLIASPALLVAMTLIAATVSLRFVRFGQSGLMILGGIVAGFLLYVVTVLVKAFGSVGFLPPAIAAWFPVVIATFYGVTYLLYKEDG